MLEGLTTWTDTAIASAAGAAVTFFGLRRRYSSDSAAIVKDKAESNIITTLIAERDAAHQNAREAWAQRVSDAQEIGKLQGQNLAQEKEMSRLRDELFALRLHIRKMASIIVRFDPETAKLMGLASDSDGIPVMATSLDDIVR